MAVKPQRDPMSVANRDEALRALQLAQDALDNDGNVLRAERLCRKAISLHDTVEAQALLSRITSCQTASDSKPTETVKEERTVPSKVKEEKSEIQVEYTVEQATMVERILSHPPSTPLHTILDLEDADPSDAMIKQAYKKWALKLHPDKNRHPKASEAFKRISHAFTVLSDPNQRARYMAGETTSSFYESTSMASEGGGRRTRMYEAGDQFEYFGENISPEDIFRMFFGGGLDDMLNEMHYQQRHGDGMRQRRRGVQRGNTFFYMNRTPTPQRQERREEGQTPWYWILLQLTPVLLLFFLSFASELFITKQPDVAFTPTSNMPTLKYTTRGNTAYYVNDEQFVQFQKETQSDSRKFTRFEAEVDNAWLRYVSSNCQREKEEKRRMKARMEGVLFGWIGRDEEGLRRAERMETPWCDLLARL